MFKMNDSMLDFENAMFMNQILGWNRHSSKWEDYETENQISGIVWKLHTLKNFSNERQVRDKIKIL